MVREHDQRPLGIPSPHAADDVPGRFAAGWSRGETGAGPLEMSSAIAAVPRGDRAGDPPRGLRASRRRARAATPATAPAAASGAIRARSRRGTAPPRSPVSHPARRGARRASARPAPHRATRPAARAARAFRSPRAAWTRSQRPWELRSARCPTWAMVGGLRLRLSGSRPPSRLPERRFAASGSRPCGSRRRRCRRRRSRSGACSDRCSSAAGDAA